MRSLKIIIILLATMHFSHLGFCQENRQVSDLEILDHNKDGVINPYEALDVLLKMRDQKKGELNVKDIHKVLRDYREDDQEEMEDMMKELDANKNGVVEFNEVKDEEFLYYMQLMDTDGSKSVTKNEMMNFRIEDSILLNDKDLKKEILAIFKSFDRKEFIALSNLDEEEREEIQDWDLNQDGKVYQQEAFDYMKPNNMEAEFKVKANVAYMNGVICSSTPARVLQLIFENPKVKTIEMENVPGSIDDVSNLRASLYIKKFGLNTRLNSKSRIASGGTDFFLAGTKRSIAKGAKIGVHSWGGGTEKATDLPKNHKSHKKYLNYYNCVNIPEEFYWFTLKAAPAESIHNMTEEEIEKYKIRTN